jgi:hypothetical protein
MEFVLWRCARYCDHVSEDCSGREGREMGSGWANGMGWNFCRQMCSGNVDYCDRINLSVVFIKPDAPRDSDDCLRLFYHAEVLALSL